MVDSTTAAGSTAIQSLDRALHAKLNVRSFGGSGVTCLTYVADLCLVGLSVVSLSGCIRFSSIIDTPPQSDDYDPPQWTGSKVPAVLVEYKNEYNGHENPYIVRLKEAALDGLRDSGLFTSVETYPIGDPSGPHVRLRISSTTENASYSCPFFGCSSFGRFLNWIAIFPVLFPMQSVEAESRVTVVATNWEGNERIYTTVGKAVVYANNIDALFEPWGSTSFSRRMRRSIFNQMKLDPQLYTLAPGTTPAMLAAKAHVRETERKRIDQEQRRLAEERARQDAERDRINAELNRLAAEQRQAVEAQLQEARDRIAEERRKLETENRQLVEARARQEAEEKRLIEERRRMEVAAASKAADEASDQRGVRIDGQAPASYVQSQYSKAWAVVIGIDQYRKNIPKLRYAIADAKAVGDALEAQGFSVIRVYNDQATREHILGVLGDELPLKVKPNDRLVIFWAGHGETRSIEGAQEMGYLLPVDANRDQLHRTSINMGEIRQLAALLPAKHVLFIVDTCYGGIAGQQFRSLPDQTVHYLKQVTRERGRQLITAGGPGQQVVEGPQWGHSAFTYYLLEGLKGLADLNDDGIIPASELYAYLDGRVPAAAENQQRPEMWSLAVEKGEFVFIPPKQPGTGSVGVNTKK